MWNRNSSSNSTVSNGPQSPSDRLTDIERKQIEFQISNRFMDVLLKQVRVVNERIITKATRAKSTSKNDTTFQLEPAEQKILYHITTYGLWEGTAVGIVTFVLLRRMRSALNNRIVAAIKQHNDGQQQAFRNAGNNFTNDTATTGTSTQFHVKNSPFASSSTSTPPPPPPPPSFVPPLGVNPTTNPLTNGPPQMLNYQPSTISNIFGWIIDGMVSFSVAATASFYLMDIDTAVSTFAKIPLVEGKSNIVTEFCPVMIQEYSNLLIQSQQQGKTNDNKAATTTTADDSDYYFIKDNNDSTKNNNDDDSTSPDELFGSGSDLSSTNINPSTTGEILQEILRNPESKPLKALLDFCTNCQKRYAYEEYLRQSNEHEPNMYLEDDDDVDNGTSNNSKTSISIPPPGVPSDFPIPSSSLSSSTK